MGRSVSVVVIAAAVLLGGSGAFGAIPGTGGKIDACYTKIGGLVRVVDKAKGESCGSKLETPLSWNQAGAAGPVGPKGDIGPAGVKGEKGDAGLAGAAGAKGEKGDVGADGIKGEKGDTGAEGASGAKGDTGPAGAPGVKGEEGDAGPPGTTGQAANTSLGTGNLGLGAASTAFSAVPGLSQTVAVPANSTLYISTDGGLATSAGTVNQNTVVDVALFIDGIQEVRFQRLTLTSPVTIAAFDSWSMAYAAQLTPGTHTIHVAARLSNNGTVGVSGDSNSPLQGQLTVLTLKT
jgi:Collagen triple helix repeat (20 copies)